jgi:ABC-type glycerol-3-phosphate transport system substrate-binding protein
MGSRLLVALAALLAVLWPASAVAQYVPDREPRYAQVRADALAAGVRPAAGAATKLDGPSFTARADEGKLRSESDFEGRPGATLLWGDDVPWVEWTIEAPTEGLYVLLLEYFAVPGKRTSIQRGLQIDGQYPFLEAKRLVLHRSWRETRPPERDREGNDLRPPQAESPRWETAPLTDGEGWYARPLELHLKQGANRLRLITIREPIAIRALHVVAPSPPPTYAEARARWQQLGIGPASVAATKVPAEAPSAKADPTLRAEVSYDPIGEPPAEGLYRLNAFGGWRWRLGGRWAEWTIEAPEDGLYALGFRVWQGFENGVPVGRTIEIDGQVPFAELGEVLIPWHREWQLFQPRAPDGEPYLVHLTKGQHTLRLTPTIGPARETLWAIDETMQEMSRLAREVTQITGPEPDPYREWNLVSQVPDVVPRLEAMAVRLEAESDRLTAINGRRPNAANTLLQVAEQLHSLAADPDSLPRRIDDFLRSETTLGYWLLNLRQMPLMLDYIVLAGPDAPMPRATATWLEQGLGAARNFATSFVRDYTSIGSTHQPGEQPGPVLTVWVARGREWGMIMKDMIDDEFTPQTGIRVNLQVFPPSQLGAGGLNVLLLAATAGETPDVATGVEPTLPAEFAIRGGVVALDGLAEYPRVAERFRPGALVPYTYRGRVYALPETQDFMMLFYRTDILDELRLKPPQTWQELKDMIWVLQQNGMDFYYPPVGQGRQGVAESSAPGFTPFLFQHGGDYYTGDGRGSALDTPAALTAFEEWTGLYTNYKIALSADFFNRMRTGEMPIGIANYWTYVQLSVAAPELTGRWAMGPMPGRQRADGSIDRTGGGQGQAVVMFPTTPHPEAAWQFMKWWTDADTQVRFGTELEGLLGVEARWNTANVQALNRLPWPKHDIEAIQEQWRWFKEREAVLGGYFTDRHLVNAWNRVVLEGWNVREASEEAVQAIDRELRKKQEEFGLAEAGAR